MFNTIDIFNAVCKGDMEIVSAFMSQGGDVNVRDQNGMTALILSVDYGQELVLRYLLQWRANLDMTDKWGQTALMIAAGRNDVISTRLLLHAGANFSLKAINGLTAIQYATDNGSSDVAAILRKQNLGNRRKLL